MIKLLFTLSLNIIRGICGFILHPRQWHVHWMQRISPLANLKIFDQGNLYIGRNTEISSYCDFEVHGNGILKIGTKTYFNRFCMISAHENVTIGSGCMFGPCVKVFDNNHKYSQERGVSTDLTTAPIVIGNNCWIASDVIILKGSTIGDNCVIGAGCIICGTIEKGSVIKCHNTQQ